jgi:sugar phosphate isomerase/epimerase
MESSICRRTFLRNVAFAAAAGAAPSLPAQPRAESGGTPPIRLGVASYTFREFMRTQLIADLRELRITGLNAKDVKDHLPMDADDEARATFDYRTNGIHVHAVGTVYFPKDEDADIRAKFEYARRAGAKVIVAGDPLPEALPRIERFVQQYDIQFAIHNHGPEDKIYHSPLDVLKAVGKMDRRMGCCIDVGHCARAGVDVVEAIHAAGPRLFNMHMKDLADLKEKESQVAVGQGKLPIREIFEALISIKYPGWVDLEYEIHGEDPMPGVTESFAYMRGVLTGMGYAANG